MSEPITTCPIPIIPKRTNGPVPDDVLKNFGQRLWSLYGGGKKFFEKEQLRRLADLIKEANESQQPRKIAVIGLDDIPVEFDVEVGSRGYVRRLDRNAQ
jgi:hypothetical protein